MNKSSIILVLFLLLPAMATGGIFTKIPLEDAERICAERALRYSDTIRGIDADPPSYMRVQEYYRSCVHAKSGSYPRQKLPLNRNLLFELNRMLGL